jgi:hypothetical protein
MGTVAVSFTVRTDAEVLLHPAACHVLHELRAYVLKICPNHLMRIFTNYQRIYGLVSETRNQNHAEDAGISTSYSWSILFSTALAAGTSASTDVTAVSSASKCTRFREID